MAKTKYIATVGLTDDKTGKRFEPGAKVTDKDFTKPVIAAWLERGYLIPEEEAADGSDSHNGKE